MLFKFRSLPLTNFQAISSDDFLHPRRALRIETSAKQKLSVILSLFQTCAVHYKWYIVEKLNKIVDMWSMIKSCSVYSTT